MHAGSSTDLVPSLPVLRPNPSSGQLQSVPLRHDLRCRSGRRRESCEDTAPYLVCLTHFCLPAPPQMPPETSLAVSHDISQILQDQLETLPLVERCFVHVDYETSHAPEHRKFY